MRKIILLLICAISLSGCTISYKFNGSNIDYSVTKTIDIRDFVNQAPLVYTPLALRLNEELKDHYTRNTKLSFVDVDADLELEGEIVRYDLTPMAVKADQYASETRLTLTVKMRFMNNKNPDEDKEETISAYRDFPSDMMLDSVQDGLIEELVKEIVDQIFQTTMSNW